MLCYTTLYYTIIYFILLYFTLLHGATSMRRSRESSRSSSKRACRLAHKIIYICIYTYTYIYIYRERELYIYIYIERERDMLYSCMYIMLCYAMLWIYNVPNIMI